jgi:hypothetical protein
LIAAVKPPKEAKFRMTTLSQDKKLYGILSKGKRVFNAPMIAKGHRIINARRNTSTAIRATHALVVMFSNSTYFTIFILL